MYPLYGRRSHVPTVRQEDLRTVKCAGRTSELLNVPGGPNTHRYAAGRTQHPPLCGREDLRTVKCAGRLPAGHTVPRRLPAGHTVPRRLPRMLYQGGYPACYTREATPPAIPTWGTLLPAQYASQGTLSPAQYASQYPLSRVPPVYSLYYPSVNAVWVQLFSSS